MTRGRPPSDGPKKDVMIGLWVTPEQKRLYDSWSDGSKYLRRCIETRGVGDKEAVELRMTTLRQEISQREKELEDLQAHLDDFLSPKDEIVQSVVQRFFELGMYKADEFTQKNWLTGPGQLGDDDEAFRKAWEMIQGKSNGEEGWGGD